jgi:hypothetical protein
MLKGRFSCEKGNRLFFNAYPVFLWFQDCSLNLALLHLSVAGRKAGPAKNNSPARPNNSNLGY